MENSETGTEAKWEVQHSGSTKAPPAQLLVGEEMCW